MIRAIKSDSTTGARPLHKLKLNAETQSLPPRRGGGGGADVYGRVFFFFLLLFGGRFSGNVYTTIWGNSPSPLEEEDFEARLRGTSDDEDEDDDDDESDISLEGAAALLIKTAVARIGKKREGNMSPERMK